MINVIHTRRQTGIGFSTADKSPRERFALEKIRRRPPGSVPPLSLRFLGRLRSTLAAPTATPRCFALRDSSLEGWHRYRDTLTNRSAWMNVTNRQTDRHTHKPELTLEKPDKLPQKRFALKKVRRRPPAFVPPSSLRCSSRLRSRFAPLLASPRLLSPKGGSVEC